MYDKVDDKEKQMDFSQIQPERRDIWGNSKARYLVEFQSFSLSHQHSYVAMKTYKKNTSQIGGKQKQIEDICGHEHIQKNGYHIVMEDKNKWNATS